MFLWALTEYPLSDHRSCLGVQGTAAQACSEGWAHGHRGSSCGAGACVSSCVRKWSLLYGRDLLQAWVTWIRSVRAALVTARLLQDECNKGQSPAASEELSCKASTKCRVCHWAQMDKSSASSLQCRLGTCLRQVSILYLVQARTKQGPE